ncbi:FecCD family ABC transporter permease [Slackia equolifaciens]|uniref:FecCD family ABC transporter permease n=1 Tax=Slackia equolifaciens TaxID=498718 RepID=UPI001FE5E00D|nr:iron ABC transporter permease [Slackia equolifaciens]
MSFALQHGSGRSARGEALGEGVSCRSSYAPRFAALTVLLVVVCVAAAVMGPSDVNASDLFALLCGAPLDEGARNILVNVRLPRVAAAALAGCALAAAGAVIQGVLNNPLASPNVIGVNAGAGLAVLASAALFPAAAMLTPVAAFMGALAAATAVFLISAGSGASKLAVILAGMALTAIFGAGMNAVLIVDPDAYVGSSGFLVGGVAGTRIDALGAPAAGIAAGLAASLLLARRLDILSLGDAAAHALGVGVAQSRFACLSVAALLAGSAVSIAGLLGFVGLVVPHLVRYFFGHSSRVVIAASALAGASLVVACDLVARVAFAPYEVPVGILMALLGGPFFIYLVLKAKGASNE